MVILLKSVGGGMEGKWEGRFRERGGFRKGKGI